MPEGTARGEVEVRRADGSVRTTEYTACVALTVADDGPGMDAETLAGIFDPFFADVVGFT